MSSPQHCLAVDVHWGSCQVAQGLSLWKRDLSWFRSWFCQWDCASRVFAVWVDHRNPRNVWKRGKVPAGYGCGCCVRGGLVEPPECGQAGLPTSMAEHPDLEQARNKTQMEELWSHLPALTPRFHTTCGTLQVIKTWVPLVFRIQGLLSRHSFQVTLFPSCGIPAMSRPSLNFTEFISSAKLQFKAKSSSHSSSQSPS